MGSMGAERRCIVGTSIVGANDSRRDGGVSVFPSKSPVLVGVDLGVRASRVRASGPGGNVGFFDVFLLVSGGRDETHYVYCFGCFFLGGWRGGCLAADDRYRGVF